MFQKFSSSSPTVAQNKLECLLLSNFLFNFNIYKEGWIIASEVLHLKGLSNVPANIRLALQNKEKHSSLFAAASVMKEKVLEQPGVNVIKLFSLHR
jgi:hypothetical protein